MRIWLKNNERGFMFIELLLSVVIIGILAAIGVNQFQTSVAQRELNRATLELVNDIRWMQQLSANNETFLPPTTSQITYHYQLTLWNSNAGGTKPNYYQVIDNSTATILKELNFNNDNVNALIMSPTGATSVNITYYSYDVDRIKSGTTLENSAYQIKLTHKKYATMINYINIDSRVGRVYVNTNGTLPL